jgi:hypothetical protein
MKTFHAIRMAATYAAIILLLHSCDTSGNEEYCDGAVCKNGGALIANTELPRYAEAGYLQPGCCRCVDGWSGVRCETGINSNFLSGSWEPETPVTVGDFEANQFNVIVPQAMGTADRLNVLIRKIRVDGTNIELSAPLMLTGQYEAAYAGSTWKEQYGPAAVINETGTVNGMEWSAVGVIYSDPVEAMKFYTQDHTSSFYESSYVMLELVITYDGATVFDTNGSKRFNRI